jgi:hypothetical protein
MTTTTRILVSSETDDLVGQELFGQLDSVEVIPYDPTTTHLDERQRQAEIFVPPYRGTNRPMPLMTQMPNLRMVQITAAGTDEWANELPDGVVLAGARGAHAGPVSEWVLSAALTQYRQWPALVRFQDEHVWAHRKFAADTLRDKRALIVGAGSIGSAVARLFAAFGTESTPVVEHLGFWGRRWMPPPRSGDLNPRLLLLDICRGIDPARLPRERVALHLRFSEVAPPRWWWLVLSPEGACPTESDPRLPAVARIACTVSALAGVWLGHRTWREALAERAIRFDGTREAVRNTIGWLGHNRFADRPNSFPHKLSDEATV